MRANSVESLIDVYSYSFKTLMATFVPSFHRDSVAVHSRSSVGTLVVEDLTPFTLYTVFVEACTQFGCTRSPVVNVTTDESGKQHVVLLGLIVPPHLILLHTSMNSVDCNTNCPLITLAQCIRSENLHQYILFSLQLQLVYLRQLSPSLGPALLT